MAEPQADRSARDSFLTGDQQRRYGRYTDDPDQAHLDRYFHLDTAARDLVDVRRGEHNRLGFAVQLSELGKSYGELLLRPLVPERGHRARSPGRRPLLRLLRQGRRGHDAYLALTRKGLDA